MDLGKGADNFESNKEKPAVNTVIKSAISVAKIGDIYYETLDNAFLAVASKSGDVILDIINDVDLKLEPWGFDLKTYSSITSLTINGNNHKIDNLYCRTAATNDPKGAPQSGASNYYGTGFIQRVASNQTLTINNLTFDEAKIDDSGMAVSRAHNTSGVGVVVGFAYGKVNLDNVK